MNDTNKLSFFFYSYNAIKYDKPINSIYFVTHSDPSKFSPVGTIIVYCSFHTCIHNNYGRYAFIYAFAYFHWPVKKLTIFYTKNVFHDY